LSTLCVAYIGRGGQRRLRRANVPEGVPENRRHENETESETATMWVDDQFVLKLEYADFLRRLDKFNEATRKNGLGGHGTPRLSLRHLNGWARLYLSSTPAMRQRMTAKRLPSRKRRTRAS
jgi:hypothetical protein